MSNSPNLSKDNDWRRDYDRQRYHKRMAHFIGYLGGKCVQCGSTESLQIDHIDPSTKSFTIANEWNRPIARIMDELAKCQLLCWPHHLNKTAAEGSAGVPCSHQSRWCAREGRCELPECVARYEAWKDEYNAVRRDRRAAAGGRSRGPYKKRQERD